MADVAKLAGVSHQTVSRVLNEARTSAPRRGRGCWRRCASSTTGPNPVARALVTGRSRTLGVVSFDTTLYGPASTLFGDRAGRPRGGLLRHHRQPAALDRRRC